MKGRKAVAVKYDEKLNNAPKVIVKGKNYLAEKIIELAQEHNIYIRKDSELAELLYNIGVGEEIPEELYSIIAEVLAFVYRIRKGWLL